MTPEELVRKSCPKIGDLGWAFYFAPETLARGRQLGLDGFRFYFLGRGGVLGDVEAPVVASAFGYFEPSLVERIWSSGKQVVAPHVAARAYMECCAEFGRRKLSGLPDLAGFSAAASAVNEAADPVGLSLYSGAASQPLPEDSPARAMQLVSVLREFRGSAHLIAVRCAGLDAKTAHLIRRPGDASAFGWKDEEVGKVTAEHRAQLERADEITDQLVLPAYSALDFAGAEALLAGLDRIQAAL